MVRRPLLFIALFLFAATSGTSSAEEFSFPASRSGQIAAAYFEAFNADEAAMQEFIARYRDRAYLERSPLEARLERYAEMREMLGTLTPHSMTNENPLTILGHSSAMEGYVEISFEVQSSVPFKLSTVTFRPAEAPVGAVSRFAGWTDIEDLLERARERTGIPALAAAVVVEEEIVATAVVGLREVGGSANAESGDLFHIGSITKSVTATMLADLVEDDVLDWSTTLRDALPNMEMREEYANVTLRQLIDHQGGLQPYLTFSDEEMERLDSLAGTSTEIRAQFLAEALQRPPVAAPGQAMHYSNAGYALAGYVAEVAMGQSWEQLLEDRIFTPLALESARIGWPSSPGTPDQPRGHFGNPPELRVQGLDEYDPGDYLAPAGDVSMSITDLARYAAMHLRGLAGNDGAVLDAPTVQALHTTEFTESGSPYAGGWVVDTTADGLERHWHNGSAGTFFAMAQIIPETGRAVVILMNSGSMANNSLCMELSRELLSRF